MQNLESKEIICLFNVYAPNNAREKKNCWDSIKSQVDQENLENIIIVGDLNLTLLSSEKRGGSIVRDPAREWVEDLMQDWDLLDIKPIKGTFTWSNKRIGSGHITARLDKFLVQISFLLLGLDARMRILQSSVSDHKPISLELLTPKDLGPIPFRFSSLWIKEKDFMEKTKDCWKEPIKGSMFFVWKEKLRRVKGMLKTWAKTLPNLAAERRKTQSALERQHLHIQTAEVTKEELEKEAKLQQSFHKACLAEKEYWRLKSKSLWLKSGDRNSSFFHKQTQAKKSHNSISEIKYDNYVLKDFTSIKKAASDHFEQLYREEPGADFNTTLLDAVPNMITSKMNQTLNAKITQKEFKEALFAMDPDKSLGPEGFTPRFLQACWQIVEKEFCKMIQKSQDCQKIGGCTNSTFLALIPKEKGANTFSRFCPISLCNIGYKVITKVIANRLKRILPKIIPYNQGGVIQGRQLVDNFVLVQEAIHSSLQKGKSPNFIKWIRACVSEPWIAPLVNGRAADFFKASRGLRQACPLSPLLFVLQASILSFYLQQKQQDQDIVGLCITRGVKSINHALFADDTLLLGAATPHSVSKFKEVLEDYCKISGSVLNNAKCHIFYWNIPASTASSIARCLGFAISTSWSSFKYLGLPIFHSRALSKDWLPQLNKFKSKMQAWGSSWLNITGKSVLIKAVLSSLPLVKFSVLLAPMGIIKNMEDLIRTFLWKGGKQNKKKISLVTWDTVTRPFQQGGLNFKDLNAQKLAMRAKLIWKIIAPNPGWVHIALWRKYFTGPRTRCLDQPKNHFNSPFSKFIRKTSSLIRNHSFWIPGNGKHIHIWNDNILNRPLLAETEDMPNLQHWMSEASINSLWDLSTWNDNLWSGWKQLVVPSNLCPDLKSLTMQLHGLAPTQASKHGVRGWGTSRSGYFVAQGYVKCLERPHVPPNPAPWTGIWRIPSIPKVDHLCWLLCHQKILTEDGLQKRGFYGSSRCSLCKENTESTFHIMIECRFAVSIWQELCIAWKHKFTFPSSISKLFAGWMANYPGYSPKNKIVRSSWSALPKFISWQVWLERNRRIFQNKEQDFKLVANAVKCQLVEWLEDKGDDTNLNQQDIELGASLNFKFPKANSSPSPCKDWIIRKNENDFQIWMSNQTLPYLFFDGAAKGNPSTAEAGGIIIIPNGTTVHRFAWGLGHSSSIEAEAMALFQGTKFLQKLDYKEANVFGDS
eukprot:PITA_22851